MGGHREALGGNIMLGLRPKLRKRRFSEVQLATLQMIFMMLSLSTPAPVVSMITSPPSPTLPVPLSKVNVWSPSFPSLSNDK